MVKVSIATPTGEVLTQEADFFLVRSTQGEYAILEDHIPIVSAVDKGYVKLRKDGKETFVAMIGGLVEQADNLITVVAQEAAVAETLDEAFIVLAEMHRRAEEENRRMQKDFTISEIDLKKNIKKAKAGELI